MELEVSNVYLTNIYFTGLFYGFPATDLCFWLPLFDINRV
jgi:hypothetical protein